MKEFFEPTQNRSILGRGTEKREKKYGRRDLNEYEKRPPFDIMNTAGLVKQESIAYGGGGGFNPPPP